MVLPFKYVARNASQDVVHALPEDHSVLPVNTRPEDREQKDMLYYQHPPSLPLRISPVKVVHVSERPPRSCCKDEDYTNYASIKELLLNIEHDAAHLCRNGVPAEPIDGKDRRRPAARGKVVNKADEYGKNLFQ